MKRILRRKTWTWSLTALSCMGLLMGQLPAWAFGPAAGAKVPAGSTVKTVGHYDNSVLNRYNPSPDQEVHWSEQSWDEMFFIFTKYTVDKNELSLED